MIKDLKWFWVCSFAPTLFFATTMAFLLLWKVEGQRVRVSLVSSLLRYEDLFHLKNNKIKKECFTLRWFVSPWDLISWRAKYVFLRKLKSNVAYSPFFRLKGAFNFLAVSLYNMVTDVTYHWIDTVSNKPPVCKNKYLIYIDDVWIYWTLHTELNEENS